jgi:diguanylate cyclase
MDRYIALGLNGSRERPPREAASPAPEPDVQAPDGARNLLDRALVLLSQAMAVQDGGQPSEQIARARAVAGGATELSDIVVAVSECLDWCEQKIAELTAQRTEWQSEITGIVSLVRDAVSALAGGESTFAGGLGASAQRFEALASMRDLNQLRVQLRQEVAGLKQLAADRQRDWSCALNSFHARVNQLEEQLVSTQRDASVDVVTGVSNRRQFDDDLQGWIEGPHPRFVLATFDVDEFKQINDTHGHTAGDRALKSVGQGLRSLVRPTDVVARVGGDEFAVLLRELTLQQAEGRLKAMISALGEAQKQEDGPPYTLSCGIAEFSAGDTAKSLLQRADQALYEAKRAGKNRVRSREVAYIRQLMGR